jgi:dissimilatory sulfite reductase (desulfoviridin) alpha/beta subunit
MSMARLAGAVPPHDCIEMDASDLGVCGVWHTQRSYFAVRWNQDEQERIEKFKARTDNSFNINYRELLGAYFAVVL